MTLSLFDTFLLAVIAAAVVVLALQIMAKAPPRLPVAHLVREEPERVIEPPSSPARPAHEPAVHRPATGGGVARVHRLIDAEWIPGEFVREGSEAHQYALDTPGMAVQGDGNPHLTLGIQ